MRYSADDEARPTSFQARGRPRGAECWTRGTPRAMNSSIGQPKRVVCIGWGSLVWRPEGFPALSTWKQDGPLLPIEFARQSRRGEITLVITPGTPPVPTLWSALGVKTLDQAREALRLREGIPS